MLFWSSSYVISMFHKSRVKNYVLDICIYIYIYIWPMRFLCWHFSSVRTQGTWFRLWFLWCDSIAMGTDAEKGRYTAPEGSNTWQYLTTFICKINFYIFNDTRFTRANRPDHYDTMQFRKIQVQSWLCASERS